MAVASLPPLPEPGYQGLEDRRAMARRFIRQARGYLEGGDRLQAGEKAWGAVAHSLKAIAEQRGWRHGSHRLVESVARQIVAEYADRSLGENVSDIYHLGHENFYENHQSEAKLREVVEKAEAALTVLEALQVADPRPFTIVSNSQLKRLVALTDNLGLKIGDTSPVGFSLKHASTT